MQLSDSQRSIKKSQNQRFYNADYTAVAIFAYSHLFQFTSLHCCGSEGTHDSVSGAKSLSIYTTSCHHVVLIKLFVMCVIALIIVHVNYVNPLLSVSVPFIKGEAYKASTQHYSTQNHWLLCYHQLHY